MSAPSRGQVVIAGGATGGHRAVALAVAQAVAARGGHPHLVLDRAARGAAPLGFPATVLPDGALPGGAVPALWRRLPDRWTRALAQALWAVRGARAVVAVGGAASALVAVAARAAGVPVAVHEQNAVPGRAVQVAAALAQHRAAAFPFALAHAATVPVPVRAGFAPSPRPRRRRVLVLGGSGGCPTLVAAARQAASAWATQGVVGGFQAGAWIHDMPGALAAADLVVTPAGSATLAEAAAAGRACVVWPRADVVRDHQWANAHHLQHLGAVRVARDGAELARLVPALLATPRRVDALAAALQRWGAGDGAGHLADWALGAGR